MLALSKMLHVLSFSYVVIVAIPIVLLMVLPGVLWRSSHCITCLLALDHDRRRTQRRQRKRSREPSRLEQLFRLMVGSSNAAKRAKDWLRLVDQHLGQLTPDQVAHLELELDQLDGILTQKTEQIAERLGTERQRVDRLIRQEEATSINQSNLKSIRARLDEWIRRIEVIR